MTATLPELDEQLFAGFSTCCEWADYVLFDGQLGDAIPCARTAEWIVRTTCKCGGGSTSLVCNHHHDRAIEPTCEIVCPQCRKCSTPLSITAERI